jgi:Ca-activated chloride channel family protein
MIRFAHWWFLFLIPIAAYLFWALKKKRALEFSSVTLFRHSKKSKTVKHKIGKAFVFSGLILTIIALARPQTILNASFVRQQCIDIALVLDVSGSMQSLDFEPNRMEVARETIDNFIAQRVNDRISLIVFAGTAHTRIPLTLDSNIVRESLAGVSTESVGTDGTAIGMGISVGINRLRKSDASSRIIILLTDGDNNSGEIDPLTASRLAQELGIRIYTIGVGTDTMIFPVQVFGQTQLQHYPGGFDEELLKQISEATGGQYFRAEDPTTLSRVFDTINQLERSDFQDNNLKVYNELAYSFIKASLSLLFAGIVLDKYYFVQIP